MRGARGFSGTTSWKGSPSEPIRVEAKSTGPRECPLREEKCVQRDQSVPEMAQEILLARQAMALVRRSKEPLIEALEDLLKAPAGSQPFGTMGAPDQEEEPLLYPSFGYYLDESDPDI